MMTDWYQKSIKALALNGKAGRTQEAYRRVRRDALRGPRWQGPGSAPPSDDIAFAKVAVVGEQLLWGVEACRQR